MLSRYKFFIEFIIFLSICYPALAQEGEKGNNQQSPVQVIVTIVVTAIVLRVLHTYKLP